MNAAAASTLAYVEAQGVVLVSAKGPAARLVEAIAGEAIVGSWWSHPRAHEIFAVLSQVCESEQVLVCRLVNGKVSLVHRRLWPALARLADRLPPERVCRVRQEHTASGHHVSHEERFPEWVPAEVMQQARSMTESEALAVLGRWLETPAARGARARRR